MLDQKTIDAVIAEWKAAEGKLRIDMLAARLVSPDHMVRLSVGSLGELVIEVEDRDEKALSKGTGLPQTFSHELTTEEKTRVVKGGVTIDAQLKADAKAASLAAAIAAKEAAYTPEQIQAKAEYEQAIADLEAKEEAARALDVLSDPTLSDAASDTTVAVEEH